MHNFTEHTQSTALTRISSSVAFVNAEETRPQSTTWRTPSATAAAVAPPGRQKRHQCQRSSARPCTWPCSTALSTFSPCYWRTDSAPTNQDRRPAIADVAAHRKLSFTETSAKSGWYNKTKCRRNKKQNGECNK